MTSPVVHVFKTAFAIVSALTCQPAICAAATGTIPGFDHVVIVIMENTSDASIIGNTAQAPYINSLADAGVYFSDAHAVTHPSQPNYLALFSGSTQGITDDSCPHHFNEPNLASELRAASLTFTGYSESMPADGFSRCTAYPYARKHNPWVNFNNVPNTGNLRFSRFPVDFATLPTLAIVVPNLCNDMHDCPIATGDAWLQDNIDAYVQWARTRNSLLILTWDEDDSATTANRIPLVFAGANVRIGYTSTATVTHYNVLRTLEDMYGLPPLGNAANVAPITEVWVDDRVFADGFD
jgi:hypothetical protein